MAIQLSIEYRGIVCDQAYIRILEVSCDYNLKIARIAYVTYVSQDARNNDNEPIIYNEFKFVKDEDFDRFFGINVISAEGVNPIGQAYNFLKTQSELADAVDC